MRINYHKKLINKIIEVSKQSNFQIIDKKNFISNLNLELEAKIFLSKIKKINLEGYVVVIENNIGINFWKNILVLIYLKIPIIPLKSDLNEKSKKKIFKLFSKLLIIKKNKFTFINNKIKNSVFKDICFFCLTGGSTGDNKVVCLDYSSIYKNAFYVKKILNFKKKDKLFINIPFHFISSISHFFSAIFSECIFYCEEETYYPKDLIDYILLNKINYFGGAPIQLDYIVNSNIRLISLKKVISSGDYLFDQTVKKYKKNINNFKIIQFYGLTEVGGRFFYKKITKSTYYETGLVGRPLKYLRFHLNKNSGELVIKNSSIFNGYLNSTPVYNPLGLKKFNTGDLGLKSKKGQIKLISRKDDVFKVFGLKVFPSLIKESLMKLDYINDCHVTSYPIKNYGNLPIALISSTKKINIGFINEYIKKQFHKHSILYKCILVKKIPRIGNNKIDKKKIVMLINKNV